MRLVHYGFCWTGLLTEYVYANIFNNIFGMTVDVNISVMDTGVLAFRTADPHACPLCVLTAWSPPPPPPPPPPPTDLQAHKYFNWLRHSDLCDGDKILVIIASGNGLIPVWCQVSVWTNDYILSTGHLGKILWHFNHNTNIFHSEYWTQWHPYSSGVKWVNN